MRITIKILIMFSTVIGMASATSAVNRIDLVENSSVKIERLTSKGYRIMRVFAYNESDTLVVSGRVKRWHSTPIAGGHVDVAVVSPSGNVVDRVSTYYIPQHTRRSPWKGSYFKVEFSDLPPEGSTIRVIHHRIVSPRAGKFQCENNLALPTDS